MRERERVRFKYQFKCTPRCFQQRTISSNNSISCYAIDRDSSERKLHGKSIIRISSKYFTTFFAFCQVNVNFKELYLIMYSYYILPITMKNCE